MADKILKSFDVWIAAQGVKSRTRLRSVDNISLEGIARLRELILDLAIRGKLVSQNSEEEAASKQIKHIEVAREKLIREGKLKRSKDLPTIEVDGKIPLPKGWTSERFGNIFNVINGRAYKMHEMLQTGTPLLRVGNLFTSDEWFYSDLELEPEKYIDNGDLIYAWSASFGPFIWNGGKVIYHYHIWKLEPFSAESISKRFFLHYLNAVTKSIKNSGNGIAMIHMTKERMEKLVVALPPLGEQHRIVAKVEELMALCDELEKQETHHLKSHALLVETLLSTLTQAKNAKEFQQAWSLLAQHFDDLFTTEDSIDQLKQTILQLAVMGKLVPQDPKDEPASVLLEKIRQEKERLIEDGEIKEQKSLPKISKDEVPFIIPTSWQYTRIGEVTNYGLRAQVEPTEVLESDWVLELEDIEKVTSALIQRIYARERPPKSSRNRFFTGDVLYGKLRPYLDKVIVADADGVCTTEMIPLKGYISIHSEYLRLIMKSPYFVKYASESTHGMNLPRLGTDKARLAIIPLAPENEQQRIVSKVNELFALCDGLKARLAAAQTLANQMAEGVVEHVN